MSSQFFPSSSPYSAINGRPNNPVRFEDLNTNNFLMVFETTWTDEDGVVQDVFQVEYLEGGGSNVELKRTTYLFQRFGLTLAGFKALLDAQAPDNNVVNYDDLFAIDFVDKTIATRDVLVNDDRIVRRVYNVAGDYTTLYLNAGNEWQYKRLFVLGDQESGFDWYYDTY